MVIARVRKKYFASTIIRREVEFFGPYQGQREEREEHIIMQSTYVYVLVTKCSNRSQQRLHLNGMHEFLLPALESIPTITESVRARIQPTQP